jgi:hypothetical protein
MVVATLDAGGNTLKPEEVGRFLDSLRVINSDKPNRVAVTECPSRDRPSEFAEGLRPC